MVRKQRRPQPPPVANAPPAIPQVSVETQTSPDATPKQVNSVTANLQDLTINANGKAGTSSANSAKSQKMDSQAGNPAAPPAQRGKGNQPQNDLQQNEHAAKKSGNTPQKDQTNQQNAKQQPGPPKKGKEKTPKVGKEEIKLAPQPEKGILKVRFGPGTAAEKSDSHSPHRRYPFLLANTKNVHPAFTRMNDSRDQLYGIESVILEFLNTLATFVNEYTGTKNGPPYRDQLLTCLQPQLSALTENGLRRFPLPLGNVIRHFKRLLESTKADATAEEIKLQCREWLDDFHKQNMIQATISIVSFTIEKILCLAATNIVVFGWSPVVERVLIALTEKENCPPLDISVLDSEPAGKALPLAKEMAKRGAQVTYGQLNAVGEVMTHAQIVLLGGSAVLSNGYVLASRGSGIVALAAKSQNIPVLVTVKSYQFVDKVRTMEKYTGCALDTEPLESIPADLITALVTEIRILPPTSAPAVLKAKQLVNTT